MELPPAARLIYATAHKEAKPDDDGTEVNQLAIGAMAELMGVARNSRSALMITKRLLRRQPVWSSRKQTTASTRMLLVFAAIIIGLVVGWLSAPGGVNLLEVLDAFSNQ